MVGTVTALRRYPVTSMLGEDVDASDVSYSGLAWDRRLAVVSRRTSKVTSAKYPRLWRDLLTRRGAGPGRTGGRPPRSRAPVSTPRCSDPAGSASATPSAWPDGRISTVSQRPIFPNGPEGRTA